MKTRFWFLTLLLNCFLTPVFSEEVCVGINFSNSHDIYRIKTDNESVNPVGWFFSTDNKIYGYFIDVINNHRFICKQNESEEVFEPSIGNLYRQVFDGLALESDMGRAGHSTCFDSRDRLIPGENGKSVYRTKTSVFSAGTGSKVDESKALSELVTNECEIKQNKNWYMIPNGSWYQTWFSVASGTNLSYDIYYDRWEEKKTIFFEEVWRGDSLYKAFERPIGIVPNKRLIRAKVDGALEEIEDGAPKTVLETAYKSLFYMLPGSYNKESKAGCYYWFGTQKGEFNIESVKTDIEPIYESLDPDSRFVCYGTAITGLRKYYILGTDILKQWLKKYAFPTDKCECTNVAFIALENGFKTMIFVYSKPEDCIYRFIIDEDNEITIGLPKKTKIEFKVAAMCVSKRGTLYLIPEIELKEKPEIDNFDGIEMETSVVEKTDKEIPVFQSRSDSDSDENFEEKNKILNLLSCNADCNLILSRAYYQKFYELPFGADTVKKLEYEMFLGKEYFSCMISFKNIRMSKLDGNLDILLEESKKPGNHVDQVKDKVPGYDNTFRKPESYYLAVFNE